MLDGSVKTVMVDDSKTVGELLVTICSRIGERSHAKLLDVALFLITCLFFFHPLWVSQQFWTYHNTLTLAQSQESVFIFLIRKPASWYCKHLSISLSHKWELLFPFQNKMNSQIENNVFWNLMVQAPTHDWKILSKHHLHYLLKTHGDSLYNHIRHCPPPCFSSSPQRTSLSPFCWVGQNVCLVFW